jgi:hypothetical protein
MVFVPAIPLFRSNNQKCIQTTKFTLMLRQHCDLTVPGHFVVSESSDVIARRIDPRHSGAKELEGGQIDQDL